METISLVIIAVLLTSSLILLYRYLKLKNHATKIERELYIIRAEHDEIVGELKDLDTKPITAGSIDGLTGLPNRGVFEDRLSQALHLSKRQQSLFAIIALEIDNLNEINKLEKETSDELLKEFSRRLQMSVRQVDTLSRFAGGYFLFLLPHLSRPETAIYVTQRIQDSLLQSFKIFDKEIKISVSMGIAVHPIDGNTTEGLIKNADTAMRRARESGANQYQFYQPELHNLGQRELSLAQLIRGDSLFKSLFVNYKPFFNVHTNQPICIQAASHIHHPKFGMISSREFSSIAENSGKILEMNEWLLQTALTQLKKWSEQNFKPTHLSISVTLRQLENPHFIYKISETLKETDMIGTKLILEISDDKMPQNPLYLEKLFTALNESGIEVTIGVIALAHFAMQKINKIPLNYLKIDPKITHDATAHEDKEAILSSIIELARAENIIVMAEGVDTDRQKQRLQLLGCELMEGKLFGYLMPTGSMEELES